MTVNKLLLLGGTANKCLFANLQYCRPQLQIQQYRHIRNLRKLGFFIKKPKFSSPNVTVELEKMQPSKLWKHLGFAITFSGVSMVGAMIWQYENARRETYKILDYYKKSKVNRTGWRAEMEAWWKKLSEGERVFVPILFLNVVVFLAWRVPALQKTMMRYFTSNPASSVSCWPMVFSMFSHYNVFHLAVNMWILHSFSTTIVMGLGKEQFLAFYLSAGVTSNFLSYIYKTICGLQLMSLGASGGIMGIIAFISSAIPDLPLCIVFLPMITFSASTALKALMVIDTTGCIARWKYIDHAAHLGGALFGLFWFYWGYNFWRKQREPILQLWQELREPRKSQ